MSNERTTVEDEDEYQDLFNGEEPEAGCELDFNENPEQTHSYGRIYESIEHEIEEAVDQAAWEEDEELSPEQFEELIDA